LDSAISAFHRFTQPSWSRCHSKLDPVSAGQVIGAAFPNYRIQNSFPEMLWRCEHRRKPSDKLLRTWFSWPKPPKRCY
jgi:hypothetical protein